MVKGRPQPGESSVPPAERLRLTPLPSIGHEQADGAIRRLWVTPPTQGPFDPDDVTWALDGVMVANQALLMPATPTDAFERHYGIHRSYTTWESVTPVVLPHLPQGQHSTGLDRLRQEARLAHAVAQAMRHARIRAQLDSIRVQREPWHRYGHPSQDFSTEGRWTPDRFWHVRMRLTRPVMGPLVLGDGRFVGLGVLAPVQEDNV